MHTGKQRDRPAPLQRLVLGALLKGTSGGNKLKLNEWEGMLQLQASGGGAGGGTGRGYRLNEGKGVSSGLVWVDLIA